MKAAVEKLAKQEGLSLNRFVATAVAEKLTAVNTVNFFAERKNRADYEAFRKILTREGASQVTNYQRTSSPLTSAKTYKHKQNINITFIVSFISLE